jgi:hypothetical protein
VQNNSIHHPYRLWRGGLGQPCITLTDSRQGTSCTTDDDCSDELICSESSICIDPYGITPTALTWTPPNFLSFGCYNRTWRVPPPSGCEGHTCHGESLWAIRLEVHGVNFNVGHVHMIISQEGNATSYFDSVISAAAGLPGLPSGAFDLKTTTVPCSLGGGFVVDVFDECTGTWIQKNVA